MLKKKQKNTVVSLPPPSSIIATCKKEFHHVSRKTKTMRMPGRHSLFLFLPCLSVLPPQPQPLCPRRACLHAPLIHAGPQPACVPPSSWSDFLFQKPAQHHLAKSPRARAGGVRPGAFRAHSARRAPCLPRSPGFSCRHSFPLLSSPWALIPHHHHPLRVPSSTRARPFVSLLKPLDMCGHEGTLSSTNILLGIPCVFQLFSVASLLPTVYSHLGIPPSAVDQPVPVLSPPVSRAGSGVSSQLVKAPGSS